MDILHIGVGKFECRINVLQRRFFGILSRRGHIDPSLSFNILCFESVFNYFALLKLYKVYRFDNHSYFCNIIDNLVPIHNYSTRFSNNNNILLPANRLTVTQKSFLPTAIMLWNNVPLHIKQINSYHTFKHHLKIYLLLSSNWLSSLMLCSIEVFELSRNCPLFPKFYSWMIGVSIFTEVVTLHNFVL